MTKRFPRVSRRGKHGGPFRSMMILESAVVVFVLSLVGLVLDGGEEGTDTQKQGQDSD